MNILTGKIWMIGWSCKAMVLYIDSVGLLTEFEERSSDIMDKTINIGWGFHDTLSDYFYQYYS